MSICTVSVVVLHFPLSVYLSISFPISVWSSTWLYLPSHRTDMPSLCSNTPKTGTRQTTLRPVKVYVHARICVWTGVKKKTKIRLCVPMCRLGLGWEFTPVLVWECLIKVPMQLKVCTLTSQTQVWECRMDIARGVIIINFSQCAYTHVCEWNNSNR